MKKNKTLTDEALEALAKERATRTEGKTFDRTEQAFAERFFTAAQDLDSLRRRKQRGWSLFLGATGIAAVCAFAFSLIFYAGQKNITPDSKLLPAADLYGEAEILFGNDAGILCVDDNLLTFERTESDPDRRRYDVQISQQDGQKMRLRFAAAENETIAVDQDGIRGTILVVPSDAACDVIMIELDRNGRKFNRMIVVKS